jgi:hypothetical protein
VVRGMGGALHPRRGLHEAAGEAEALQDAAAGNVIDPDILLKAAELPGIG